MSTNKCPNVVSLLTKVLLYEEMNLECAQIELEEAQKLYNEQDIKVERLKAAYEVFGKCKS